MTRGIFRAIIKEYRRTLPDSKRRSSYRVKFRWRYPHKSESRLREMIQKTFRWYTNKIRVIIMQWAHTYPVHTVRRDSFESEVNRLAEELKATRLKQNVSVSLNLTPIVEAIMAEIMRHSEEELSDYLIKRFGKPLLYSKEGWETTRRLWVAEIDSRIGGSTDAFLQKVQDVVLDHYVKRKPFEELMARIQTVSDSFTKGQSQFLARDLTGKLNSLVEKQLQTGIGINYYMWQTAADERVRGRPGGVYPNAVPSHWDMEHLICSWLDSTIVSYDYGKTWEKRTARMPFSHPGMDWQCRCTAIPFDIDLLREIDKELNAGRG